VHRIPLKTYPNASLSAKDDSHVCCELEVNPVNCSEKKTTILALDLATLTGYALGADSITLSGTQSFAPEKNAHPATRFAKFNRWLAFMLKSYDFNLIAYEAPHYRGGPATEVLVGLSTRVEEHAAEANIRCVKVHSLTLKKFATGNGRADKAEMLIQASVMWPAKKFSDDNECDACWIWQWAHDKIAQDASGLNMGRSD
jgi:Holliday junction resolvasome RuvABC endonuclease subunit